MKPVSVLLPAEAKAGAGSVSTDAIQPGSQSMTFYREDYQQAPPADVPQPAPLPAARPRRAIIAVAVGSLLLGVGAGFLLPHPKARRHGSSAVPVTQVREVTTADSSNCLRDTSQTIHGEERDQLLLDAVLSYDSGKPERTLELLRKYVAEACDRATLFAVDELERKLATKQKEP